MPRTVLPAAALATALAVGAMACGAASPHGSAPRGASRPSPPTPARAFIRLDQLGAPEGQPAQGRVLARDVERGATVRVTPASGGAVREQRLGRDLGRWNEPFRHVYALNLPPLGAGDYTVTVSGPDPAAARLHVAAAGDLAARSVLDGVRFFQAQRDGPDVNPGVLHRKPSHLADAHAQTYGPPTYHGHVLAGSLHADPAHRTVDVSGGWFDAGDYLKFFQGASFDDTMLAWAARDLPASMGPAGAGLLAEARYGADWLLKAWDARTRTLVYQVGIGDGNTRIAGDHGVNWRLPQADDRRGERPGDRGYYVQYRPALVLHGAISPNLAGRGAAALALVAQDVAQADPAFAHRCLNAARSLFAAAQTTHVGRLVTTSPYDYYPETEWRDDLALGAAELALADGKLDPSHTSSDLDAAELWIDRYHRSPLAGNDTLNLYDVGGLADAELGRAVRAQGFTGTRPDLAGDLRDQLRARAAGAAHDPFGYGGAYRDGDVTQHALGLSIEAALYGRMSGDPSFAAFGRRQLDLVLGGNPWGTSWVVGAGQRFPRCPHSQIANLSGSLDGHGDVLAGAAVAGPASTAATRGMSVADGHRPCPGRTADPLAAFDGNGARYVDAVGSSTTNEPTGDASALALAALVAQAAPGR